MTTPAPDLTVEQQRREMLAAVIAEGLDDKLDAATPDWWPDTEQWADDIADALLPVVRKIAADELRAAAEWLNADPDKGGAPYITGDNSVLFPDTLEIARVVSWAVASLRDRADAVDPS